jgi:N-acetylglutamate synthase-like GNAT family acetyltransferase
MTQPAFRYARQRDVPALVALIERAYRSPETAGNWVSEAHLLKGPRTSDDEISGLIAQPDSRFLIAEIDGRLAGCCLMQRIGTTECSSGDIGKGSAYFGMFAIDPGIHSTGLGKIILAEAERRVRQLWNSGAMVMTVINLRDKLIEYYQRRGYALTGATMPFPFTPTTGEVTRDFHLVEMKKDLA